jgi:hypothetical protein
VLRLAYWKIALDPTNISRCLGFRHAMTGFTLKDFLISMDDIYIHTQSRTFNNSHASLVNAI